MKISYILPIIGLLSAVWLHAQTATDSSSQRASNTNLGDSRNSSEADAKFLKKAAQGGMAEVKLSELAEKNASKAEVKEYAAMMIADHTGANTKVAALAKSKGVELPTELDRKHQGIHDELKDKKGSDFDDEYVKVMIADHKMTSKLFEKQAENGDDEEIKALANNILPTLKAHLKAAEAL